MLNGCIGTPVGIFSILFPEITKKFPTLTKMKPHKTFYSLLINGVQELIEEHKKNHNGDKSKDFIDHFLVEMLNSSAELNVEDQEDQLMTLIIDIVAVNFFFFLSVKLRF